MISVVIPLYNKARHIRNTINSVLLQTYSDFEIIVLDDGSSDGSGDIVNSICDTRIRYIKKDNEGVSKTRNRGVALAKSELIAFLDADDEWDKNYLKQIAELAVQYPNAAIYASNYYVLERNGEKYNLNYPGVPATGDSGLIDNYFISAFQYTPLWTSAVVIKKGVFVSMGGFPVEIKNGEDLDLWCRIALRYPIAFINKPLAIYRRDSDNMLSRSISVPSWYPFLDDYIHSDTDIIQDEESIQKYIIQRQLEAASSSLFVLKNKMICKRVMSGIKFQKWNYKKYYGMKVLILLPKFIINALYSIRAKKIKNYG